MERKENIQRIDYISLGMNDLMIIRNLEHVSPHNLTKSVMVTINENNVVLYDVTTMNTECMFTNNCTLQVIVCHVRPSNQLK
ncbi:hypothetical protein RCL_jg27702.t1 [Rhizophagus clarus]|uniref:Uncharacterized protein n=1 Tax=Rhizophagus clarus TaxID=94130 RepID=A0A8H3MDF3_9GLOM|nr:hypothetical protein RCL_jg27702.t1 [Rhizophagus clarus]